MNVVAARKMLKKIWTEVLGNEIVSNDLNFFDAGGNSVLLNELKKQIEEEFGVDISLIDLMTYTNIRTMAEYLSSLL